MLCPQARKAHGRNELPEDPGTPFWKLVLKQFDDYLVKILIAAAVVDLLIALTGGDYSVGWDLRAFIKPGCMHTQHPGAEPAIVDGARPLPPTWLRDEPSLLAEHGVGPRHSVALRRAFVEPGVIVLILVANGAVPDFAAY